jgi:hypothetical protein
MPTADKQFVSATHLIDGVTGKVLKSIDHKQLAEKLGLERLLSITHFDGQSKAIATGLSGQDPDEKHHVIRVDLDDLKSEELYVGPNAGLSAISPDNRWALIRSALELEGRITLQLIDLRERRLVGELSRVESGDRVGFTADSKQIHIIAAGLLCLWDVDQIVKHGKASDAKKE